MGNLEKSFLESLQRLEKVRKEMKVEPPVRMSASTALSWARRILAETRTLESVLPKGTPALEQVSDLILFARRMKTHRGAKLQTFLPWASQLERLIGGIALAVLGDEEARRGGLIK